MASLYLLYDSQDQIRTLLLEEGVNLHAEPIVDQDKEVMDLVNKLTQTELRIGDVYSDDNGAVLHAARLVSPGEQEHGTAILQELRRRGWGVARIPDSLHGLVREMLSNVSREYHRFLIRAIVNISDNQVKAVREEFEKLVEEYKQLAQNKGNWEEVLKKKTQELTDRYK